MGKFANILETIGRTPVVRINKLAPAGVELFVKLEAFNPLGSVKDRLALGVIEAAERSGALKPGQTVIEATSGNTGIGLAMVCAQKGYPLVVTMAENFSVERRKLMRFLGAKVVLTPAAEKGIGMLGKARRARREARLVPVPPVRERGQRRHPLAHHRGGDPRRLRRERLDYWVTGVGTGGTLKGVARVLKERRPEHAGRRLRARQLADPRAAAFAQRPVADGSPRESHPVFRPHLMQGWTPDFIPKLAEDASTRADRPRSCRSAAPTRCACRASSRSKEGIFAGISGGATLAGALAGLRETAPPGAKILCMLPDTGERYLSTPLFEDIAADDERRGARASPPRPRATASTCSRRAAAATGRRRP